MTEDRPDRVVVEVTVGAPMDEVWHALRDPETLKRWHGWDGYYDEIDEGWTTFVSI